MGQEQHYKEDLQLEEAIVWLSRKCYVTITSNNFSV